MEIARWQALRELFDAVCDAPAEHWEPRLRTLSEDPALIAEALDLLRAQTASFDRALQPLHALMASLPDGAGAQSIGAASRQPASTPRTWNRS